MQVLYDDGERETVNLLTESWKLSDDEAKCGSDGKSRGGDREVPGYKERVSIEPVREGVTNGRQPRDDVAASGAGQANGSAKRIKVCPKRQREEGKSAGGKRESRRRVSGRGKATMGAGLVGGEAEPVSATEGGSGGTLGAGPTDPPPAEHLEIVRDVLKMVAEVKERGGVSDGTVSAWEKGSGAEAGESENGKGGAVASGAEKRCGAVDPGVAGGETGPETLPSEELPFAGQVRKKPW